MSDYLRKGFLIGLGAAISGKEKVEEKLKELVKKNEITQEQAKNMMQSFIEKGDKKTDEWSAKQKDQIKKSAEEFGIATKEDVEQLRIRIQELEDKIMELTKE